MKKNCYLKIFFISIIIGIISFFPIYIHFEGQLMDYGDYFLQYVPFIKEMKRMLLSGSLSWSWNSFLGDNFIGAYSYYTVFNPFAWFVMLFPDKYILYGTLIATLLKLGLSSVLSLMYFKFFCKKEHTAYIGALLYTFSGFTLVNTNFYFFLDVVALFPLLLYGLENLIRNKKRNWFVFAVFINAIINYYFFVSSVFIVILYVVFRLNLYKISSWKKYWKTFIDISFSAVLGTTLAAIALIPSFFAIMGSGKAMESIGNTMIPYYWPQNILERIKILVSPIESGRYHAFFDSSAWSSTGIYLPIFGVYCVVLWILRKKDWLKKLTILLVICLFIPCLNAVFNLFSSTDYTRWLYGLVLLFSLITALQIEHFEETEFQKKDIKIFYLIAIFTGLLLLIPTAIYVLELFGISLVNIFCSVTQTDLFMGYKNLFIILILTLLNYLVLFLYIKGHINKRNVYKSVVIMCTLNFFSYNYMNFDLHATEYSDLYYYQKAMVEGEEKNEVSYEYRIDYPPQIANYSMFKNMPSINYYNSLQNSESSRFASEVGIASDIKDTILLVPSNMRAELDSLLSVKYYYDYDGDESLPSSFELLNVEKGVSVYENLNYIPMGFTYENYILEDEIRDKTSEEKVSIMLNNLVIEKEDEEILSKYLSKNLNSGISENRISCSKFEANSSGFEAEISLDEQKVVFFSIPNDKGWNLKVNGKSADTFSVNYGLMGVVCDKGINTISCTYSVPGMNLGIFTSLVSIGAWILIVIYEKKKGN